MLYIAYPTCFYFDFLSTYIIGFLFPKIMLGLHYITLNCMQTKISYIDIENA